MLQRTLPHRRRGRPKCPRLPRGGPRRGRRPSASVWPSAPMSPDPVAGPARLLPCAAGPQATASPAGGSLSSAAGCPRGGGVPCRTAAQRPAGMFTAEEAEGPPRETPPAVHGQAVRMLTSGCTLVGVSCLQRRSGGQDGGAGSGVTGGQRAGEAAARAQQDQAGHSGRQPGGAAGKTRDCESAR